MNMTLTHHHPVNYIDQSTDRRVSAIRSRLNVGARLTIAAMVLNSLAGCQAPTPTKAEREAAEAAARVLEEAEAEIRAELESYYRDLSARRWNAFASHFWPGATIATIWQPKGEPRERVHVQSVAEFIAQTPEGADSKSILSERMLDAEIHVQDGLAQAWVRYEAEFGEPGEVTKWTGVDAFSIIKFDGRWRIVSLTFAPQ